MIGTTAAEAAPEGPPELALSLSAPRRDERALVRAARNGSREAAEALARSRWDDAYRSAYFIVQDSTAAEDIAQEAMVAALGSLGRFRLTRPFGPWLHRITVNRAIDWVRAARRRAEVPLDEPSHIEHPPTALETAEVLPNDLQAALRALDPEDRAIVVLRHLFDYRAREIGRMLEMPASTVRTRLQGALERLRMEIEEETP